jgi:hypothetical protein
MGIPLLPQGILSRYFRSRGADYFRPCWLFFGGVVFCSPTVGIAGSTCVGIVEIFSTDCVLIGPVGVGLISGILDTARRSGRIGLEGGPFEPPY